MLAHRGKLAKIEGLPARSADWALVFCLRVATLLCRSRVDVPVPRLGARSTDSGFQLALAAGWLDEHPLTAAASRPKPRTGARWGCEFDVRSLAADKAQAAG